MSDERRQKILEARAETRRLLREVAKQQERTAARINAERVAAGLEPKAFVTGKPKASGDVVAA